MKHPDKPIAHHHDRANSRSEKLRFYSLLVLLALSIALAWVINSGVSQTLGNQFN